MKLDQFVGDRRTAWQELEALVGEARGKGERLGPHRLRRLGELYRGAAADLSLGRRHFPDDPAVRRLEAIVIGARPLVYDGRGRLAPVDFLTRGYWRAIAARPVPLLASALLLFGPAAAAFAWALIDPDGAAGLVPAVFADAVDPGPLGTDQGLTAAEQTAFSTALFTNNIRVTFLAFAGGIVFALGTALLLAYNGLILGAVAGVLAADGNLGFFVELVAAHGVLELSAIVIAGAAGLRMGWALVEPGFRPRSEALVAEAREAVLLVLGTMPWLVVAGIIEAFISRRGISATPMAAVGIVVGGLFWALVVLQGRAPAPPAGQSRARSLARR